MCAAVGLCVCECVPVSGDELCHMMPRNALLVRVPRSGWTEMCIYTYVKINMCVSVCTLTLFSSDGYTQHISLFCVGLTPLNNNSASLRPAPTHHQSHTVWTGAAN